MGQQGSGVRGCCTTREHAREDVAREDDQSTAARGGSTCMGGCCGDSGARRGDASARNNMCSVECMGKPSKPGEGSDQSPRVSVVGAGDTLFGDETLRPKLQRLWRLESEHSSLTDFLKKVEESSKTSIAPEYISGQAAAKVAQWIQVLQQNDALFEGGPQPLLFAAFQKVFAAEEVVQAKGLSENYGELLRAVGSLVKQRLREIEQDASVLEQEEKLTEAENFIGRCFEKIDEEGIDEVTKEQFITFLCDDTGTPGTSFSLQDAEGLFEDMSHGDPSINYERFKDEASQECLQALELKIDERRRSLRRFRDCGVAA